MDQVSNNVLSDNTKLTCPRCFELLSLQARDLTEGCLGPDPYYIPHFKVKLLERKGWQNETGYDGPREGVLVQLP